MPDFAIAPEQLRTFAQDGYIVLPGIVSPELIAAARHEIARRVADDPPPPDHRGPHFYFIGEDIPTPLLAPLNNSRAATLVRSLMANAPFDPPEHVQISRNVPPWSHHPGGPHIDGLTPPEADGRPGTFTVLAGIFLTDQSNEDAGNLWVWPGSHTQTASYLRDHGADALRSCIPYAPVTLTPPRQVTARAGDLLLAHYLLGHNMGGNVSDTVREVLYYRLRREHHRARWREVVQNPLLEFEHTR